MYAAATHWENHFNTPTFLNTHRFIPSVVLLLSVGLGKLFVIPFISRTFLLTLTLVLLLPGLMILDDDDDDDPCALATHSDEE